MNKKPHHKNDLQLGMNHSTAASLLRKSILFQFVKETHKDVCFHCGEIIDNINDLSIEHKIPYLDSDDPVKLFFDLDNIAYSHLRCNSLNTRGRITKFVTIRCDACNKAFTKLLTKYKMYLKKGQTKFYCSKACVHKSPSVDLAGEHSDDGPVVAVTE